MGESERETPREPRAQARRGGGCRASSHAVEAVVRAGPGDLSSEVGPLSPQVSRDHVVGTQAEVSCACFGMRNLLSIAGKRVSSGDTGVQS